MGDIMGLPDFRFIKDASGVSREKHIHSRLKDNNNLEKSLSHTFSIYTYLLEQNANHLEQHASDQTLDVTGPTPIQLFRVDTMQPMVSKHISTP